MPGWRQFLEENPNTDFEFVSIALDHEGPEASRPFALKVGSDVSTLIDAEGKLASHYGFHIIPNGYFVDENGTLVYAKHGFRVENEDDVDAVRRFIATGDVPAGDELGPPYVLSPSDYERIAQLMRESQTKRAAKDVAGAAELMRQALRMDPGNFTIRKQIWSLEHPERFYPTIDFAWQKEQLAQERERESAAGWFDADGQFVPPA